MKKESSFLNQVQLALLDEIDRFIKLSGAKEFIELNAKQYKTWCGIVRKAQENPAYDYAKPYNFDKGTYHGCRITSTAKRKLYSKQDNSQFQFEGD